MRKRGAVLSAFLVLVWGLAAPAWGQISGQKDKPLARVGTQELTAAEMKALLDTQSDEMRQQILANPKQLEEIAKGEAERKALLAEARKAGVEKRPEAAFAIQRAQEQAILDAYLNSRITLPQGFPTEDEIASYYAKNKERFLIPEQVELSTIFLLILPAWAGDKALEAKIQAEAASISAQARRVGADFGELARRYSQDRPTADRGGVVGWVTAAQLLPELAKAVLALKPGEVSDPIRTQLGYQVIRVNDRKPAVQRTLTSEVRGEVIQILRNEYRIKKVRELTEAALKQHPISVDGSAVESWRLDEVKIRRAR